MLARAAIYLDSNAGAPLSKSVVEALLPFLQENRDSALNASSLHAHGRNARRWLNEARAQVARSLAAREGDLVFTSSGTEANQLAIRSILEPALESAHSRGPRPHWILTRAEHDSCFAMARWFERRGGEVSFLELDARGAPDPARLATLWRPETVLLSALWVNNETGVITDIEAFASEAKARGVAFHADGVQAWGKVPVNLGRLAELGVSLVSFSGHKVGALPGSGVLWSSLPLSASAGTLLGKQEGGRRGGTENLLAAVALGAAASTLEPVSWASRLAPLRQGLEQQVLSRISGSRVHGAGAERVANTANLGFEGIERAGLVAALDLAGYSVSSGAACSSGVEEPSRVLQAMGLGDGSARGAVRVSLSERNTPGELEGFVGALASAVERMRKGRGAA